MRKTFPEKHKQTIGADFCTKSLDIDDKTVVIQAWDTAGEESWVQFSQTVSLVQIDKIS